jgi:thiamine biosynthesis lipoprotein
MSVASDTTFRCMGSDIRMIIEPPLIASLPSPVDAAERERAYIEDFSRRLSRFRQDSELCALNADPAAEVGASLLLRTAVAAGLWAAERSGGLVDPTLVGEIERVGYVESQDHSAPASLQEALASAPTRMSARPRADARWQQIVVDHARGSILRPPGLRIDTGGTGKGLAADAVAHRLRGYRRFVIDCGGDIAVGGVAGEFEPLSIEVEHPLSGECVHTLRLSHGGVATSGLNVRIWRRDDDTFAHHLLNPADGEPVWSGLIGATALASSTLEAETLSKIALLSGSDGARTALAEHGGVLVHDDGDVEIIEPAHERGARMHRNLRGAA